MDHAEAAARLEEMVLEPATLKAIETSHEPWAAAFRGHAAECPACGDELASWLATYRALDLAAVHATGRVAQPEERLVPSEGLRARTLAQIREAAVEAGSRDVPLTAVRRVPARPDDPAIDARPARRSSLLTRAPWLAFAAAVVLLVVSGGFLVDRQARLDSATASANDLAAATLTLQRVLGARPHWVATLHDASGQAAGTFAWSDTEIVAIAQLPDPPAGKVYRCWIEGSAGRTPMGTMEVLRGVGYWAGAVDGWGAALSGGGTVGVSLADARGAGGATPMLSGSL